MNNDELESIYQEFWQLVAEQINDGNSALEVAGIMVAQAMTIYKSVLSPEEYDQMIDTISDSRDHVQELDSDTLQ
jgi:hypothetical protein